MSSNIYNTFGIPVTADCYQVVSTLAQLHSLLVQGLSHPYFILGGGSNVVFTRHYPGTILHLENKGIQLVEDNGQQVLVQAAAGEVWDDFVRHCVSNGWHGAENLVAIPGSVGASPVQNVGAYGVEAKDLIHSVQAYEIATGQLRTFSNADCRFGYRDSIFKHELKDQYIIWSVTFHLSRTYDPDCRYAAISDSLQRQSIANPTAQQMIDTIAQIRWSKLPRPEEIGSAGSFFKNPVVTEAEYQKLKASYPDLVSYPVEGGVKLAAGWLIEHAGWKGRNLGPCGVYEKQALVLVNRGGCSGHDVILLADAVTADVKRQFGVTLEKEAIII